MHIAYSVMMMLALSGTLRGQWAQVGWEPVVEGLTRPVQVTGARDGSGRLFIVEQGGRVRISRNGALAERPFLDLTHRVGFEEEKGLLSIAFPPQFAERKRMYAFFTDGDGAVVIARYRVTEDADLADAESEEIILRFEQPHGHHNGGMLAFGPVDGMLYISVGDGGIGVEEDGTYTNDPDGAGQTGMPWQGKILRIDPEGEVAPYAVPPDNPRYADWRPEIWSIGWRNPWRFSFDRKTGDMYAGDVGADDFEELNFEPAGSGGRNYGWSFLEGTHCVPGKVCEEREGLTAPVMEYGHEEGCSVIGGVVYRGSRFPDLDGTYFFGDYCRGPVWAMKQLEGEWRRAAMGRTGAQLVSFGEDDEGEVYLVDHRGTVSRITQLDPGLTIMSIGNGASGEAGMVAGSVTSVLLSGLEDIAEEMGAGHWPLPLRLGGVTVWVNGTQAGILGVSPAGKVDFLAPYVLPEETAAVQVRAGFATSNVFAVPVVAVLPGLFTVDGRHATAVNEQGEMTRHARRGAVVAFYGSGFGVAANAPEYGYPAGDGSALNGSINVMVGGKAAEVQFAALAPGFAGVYSVVVKIAEDAETGEGDVWVEVDGVRSPAVRFVVE